MIGGSLAYVALAVTDVEAVATALARGCGLKRTDRPVGATRRTAPVFGVGASAVALFGVGDPFLGGQAKPGVHHIGIGVRDLEGAIRAAAAAGVAAAEQEAAPGLDRGRRVLLCAEGTVGVKTYLSEPLEVDRSRGGWVERIDHLGIASADNGAASDAFSRRLGYPLESQQTDLEVQVALESFTSDKYGAVYHTRPPEPSGGLRVAFITVGDCELEFLQDFDPRQGAHVAHDRPGTTKQDQGAIARFLGSRGPGLHHIALKVPDINAALADLHRAGHTLIDTVGRPGSRRALIGFIHPQSMGGVLMHLVQRSA